jgi:hypothetical protein
VHALLRDLRLPFVRGAAPACEARGSAEGMARQLCEWTVDRFAMPEGCTAASQETIKTVVVAVRLHTWLWLSIATSCSKCLSVAQRVNAYTHIYWAACALCL